MCICKLLKGKRWQRKSLLHSNMGAQIWDKMSAGFGRDWKELNHATDWKFIKIRIMRENCPQQIFTKWEKYFPMVKV